MSTLISNCFSRSHWLLLAVLAAAAITLSAQSLDADPNDSGPNSTLELNRSTTATVTLKRPNGSIRTSASRPARHSKAAQEDSSSNFEAGVLQAQRVARNARQNFKRMSSRVEQIQSIIAANHDDSQQVATAANQSASSDQEGSESMSHGVGGAQSWSEPMSEVPTGDDSTEPPAQNSSSWTGSQQQIRSVIPSHPDEEAGDQSEAQADRLISNGEQLQNSSEWAADRNLEYFNEMNAKHGGGGGALATGALQLERAQLVHEDDAKLPNRSVPYSFSAADPNSLEQPQEQAQIASELSPRQANVTASKSPADLFSSQPNRSIVTYRAGQRSSSRDSMQMAPTTTRPVFAAQESSAVESWQQSNSSTPPITWPALASPADGSVGFPAGESDAPGSSQYSTLIKSPQADQRQHGRSHARAHHELRGQATKSINRAYRTAAPNSARNYDDQRSHMAKNHQAGDQANEPTESSASDMGNQQPFSMPDSVPTASITQPTPITFTIESATQIPLVSPNRMRSIEARRQLTSKTDAILYDQHHQQQPPPPNQMGDEPNRPNTLSNRVDTASDLTPVNATSNHLKHRSSSGPMSSQEEQASAYPFAGAGSGSEDSVVSLADSNQERHVQQQQSRVASSASSYSGPSYQLASGYYPNTAGSSSLEAASQDVALGGLQNQFSVAPSTQLEPVENYHLTRGYVGSMRPVDQQQQQQFYSASPGYIQDGLQAASSNQNELQNSLLAQSQARAHQQQPEESAPSFASQNYVDQQLAQYKQALARQSLQQHQQVQRYPTEISQQQPVRSSGRPFGALAGSGMSPAQQVASGLDANRMSSLAAALHGTLRRFSPEAPTQSSSQEAAPNQDYYSQRQLVNPILMKAYQHLRQLQQQQQLQQDVSLADSAGYSQSASQSTPGASSTGQMFASSAMSQPAYYSSQQPAQEMASADMSSVSVVGDSVGGLQSSSARAPLVPSNWQAVTSGGGGSRRNYLFSNLFKPSASSRYYYSPLLSPISLASPTALHAIYAPASQQQPVQYQAQEPTGSASSLAQYYATAAATSPYSTLAVLNQLAGSQQQQQPQHYQYGQQQSAATLAAIQHYQQQLAAAALAANNYQQQVAAASSYSSPQAYAGSSSIATDAEMAESSLVPSDSSPAQMVAAGADKTALASESLGSSGGDSSSGSGSKSLGSTKQWLTVAGLLAGILPMGLVMASMLPMLSVASRRKRQLDFSARNFSDVFGSWRPARLLDALSQSGLGSGAGGSALSEASSLLGELIGMPVQSELRSGQSQLASSALNSSEPPPHKEARLLGAGPNPIRSLFASRSASSAAKSGSKQPAEQPVLNTQVSSSQQNSTSLVWPQPSTTPMPPLAAGGASSQEPPIKSTVKRIVERFSNLIASTAQRRKHRSSLVDLQWLNQPTLGSGLKSMFDLSELKRQLAELVRARLLADQSKHTQYELVPAQALARQTPAESTNATMPAASRETSSQRPDSTRTAEALPGARAVAQIQIQKVDAVDNQTHRIANHPIAGTQLETPANEPARITGEAPSHPNGTLSTTNSTRASLLACLHKVVCDLASRLRRSSRLFQERAKSEVAKTPDGFEPADKQMTKLILEQLLDHIELADKKTLIFGGELRGRAGGAHEVRNDTSSMLEQIQRAVLSDQCASTFTCLIPRQFKRSFSELRWP